MALGLRSSGWLYSRCCRSSSLDILKLHICLPTAGLSASSKCYLGQFTYWLYLHYVVDSMEILSCILRWFQDRMSTQIVVAMVDYQVRTVAFPKRRYCALLIAGQIASNSNLTVRSWSIVAVLQNNNWLRCSCSMLPSSILSLSLSTRI